MVLQRRLDYGFNGYQMLVIPRAARSARRRSSSSKKVEDDQMCAFDLLATVAGKLLLESASSPISSNTSTDKDQCKIVENTVKKEVQDEGKPLKIEPYDQGSSDMKCFASELVSQAQDQNYDSKESQHSQNDAHSGLTYVITNSNCSEALGAGTLESDRSTNETIGSKEEASLSGFRGTGDCKVETEIKIQIKDELHNTGRVPIGARADMCSLENPVAWDGKPSVQVSLDSSSAKEPLCKDHILPGSYTLSRDDVKIVSIDDDENSSGCTHPSTTKGCTRPSPIRRFGRPSSRIGDRRIRKLLASRYWKVAPKLKDGELQNTDGESKSVYGNRKNCYKRQRSQKNYPLKKRKIFYRSSVSNSSGGAGNDGISHPLEKVINRDASGSALKMHAATGTPSSVARQLSSFQSRDSHLKLRIQSIRVPELFIEIPETATVGSLKRTVMEAVTAILGGGLHVGVLLQGKKVRDDHKTLKQTGISRDNHLEGLGFTLEPTPSQVSPRLCPEDPSFRIPSGIPQPLTRYPPESVLVHQETTDTSPELHVANLDNFVENESDHDSAPSSDESSIDKNTADSKALVAVPAMSVEALAMVPTHHKSKRSELAQRRIRRPFSVTEVEALVHAVEKLGTGRWRDVKLRAFDNANHRTYVDLKDKWKTLVHTARISPQQRRGEPVPQELLDRVLAAHAYWSKQQAKQQQEACLLL